MNRATRHLIPLTAAARDSLMTVVVPHGMSDTLVRYSAFAVHFNSDRHVANCAIYELTSRELQGNLKRDGFFATDSTVTGCPTPADYAGSGMDRGHLVPVADLKWNAAAMRQSFLLTNVGPMRKTLNEGGWSKLEEKVREWVARDSALLVFTGPVVSENDTVLLNGKVVVPAAYYKIVMAPCVSPKRVIAFIYPNGKSGGDLSRYAVSINEVERLTGLDFFPFLPVAERQRLEKTVHLDAWIN